MLPLPLSRYILMLPLMLMLMFRAIICCLLTMPDAAAGCRAAIAAIIFFIRCCRQAAMPRVFAISFLRYDCRFSGGAAADADFRDAFALFTDDAARKI